MLGNTNIFDTSYLCVSVSDTYTCSLSFVSMREAILLFYCVLVIIYLIIFLRYSGFYYRIFSLAYQEHETEYNLATMVENSKAVLKADPSQFELLKVLGQGSFGKVSNR